MVSAGVKEGFLRRYYRWVHTGLVGIAFGLSVSALVNTARDHVARAIVIGSVAVACAVVAAVLAHRNIQRTVKPHVAADSSWVWRPGVVEPRQAIVFMQGILFPKLLYSRIRETVSPLARAMSFHTVYTLRLPGSNVQDGALFVPFMVVKKGRLFDDLQITAADGSARASLSYADYLELVSVIMRYLARIDGRRAHSRYLLIEQKLMRMIADRAPATDADAAVDELFRTMEHGRPARTPARQLMKSMAKILVVHYAVVVKVPVSPVREDEQWEVLSATERRMLPLDSPEFSDDPIAWFFDRFRKGLGVRSNQFKVPIEKAHLTPSYHLEFVGPPDTYLAGQDLLNHVPEPSYYLRMRPRLGQRYSHFYVRDAPIDSANWRLRLSFFERPPGSFGAAAVTAIASFCLILIAGRLASHDPALAVPGDVTAVLLSFPVVSSAWIGLERGKGPFGGTTASRLSSLVSFIASLASASIYLGAVASKPAVDGPYSLLGAKGIWAVLVGVSALNSLWICYGWLRRSVLYSAMLAKQRVS